MQETTHELLEALKRGYITSVSLFALDRYAAYLLSRVRRDV